MRQPRQPRKARAVQARKEALRVFIFEQGRGTASILALRVGAEKRGVSHAQWKTH